MATLREPAVAGRFYPAGTEELRNQVNACLGGEKPRRQARACIAPHAGYIYSGSVAGAVFSRLEIPERALVLGPNHTGRGHPLAMFTSGEWRTPLARTAIDSELAERLMRAFPALTEDSAAHRYEHSIEVELPFLQVTRPDLRFVPIAIGTTQLVILEALGEAIAQVVQETKDPVLIVTSSDMNHYEDDATTRVKDQKAIEKILALDARELHRTVIEESISMCGFAPTVVMLRAAARLGAQKAELVDYATSGDVSGDRDAVVGYAGVIVQ
jgi:AmmeMemoRadiSam system protein B